MPRVQRGKVAAISTRWTRRVAAPCVCFVPWAALASCRPLPQQLLPVSAAGGGRRRCTFFSLLRLIGPSAAAAAAPRRGAGCALSVTFGDTSPRGRGKKHSRHALGSLSKERQETCPPRSWLSLRESWREAPERVRSPAGRDKRKIKIIFPLNIAQSEAEGIFKSAFCGFKITKPRKTSTKTLESGSKKILDVLY